jgi:hypothetical protein
VFHVASKVCGKKKHLFLLLPIFVTLSFVTGFGSLHGQDLLFFKPISIEKVWLRPYESKPGTVAIFFYTSGYEDKKNRLVESLEKQNVSFHWYRVITEEEFRLTNIMNRHVNFLFVFILFSQ